MLNNIQFSYYNFLSYCKNLRNVIALVALVCSFSINASLSYTSPVDQLCEDSTVNLAKKSWLDRAVGSLGSCFNSTNLAKGSGYDRNKNNSIRYLQHMFDEHDLYSSLEAFKDKPVFEVLAVVYVNMLLLLDQLDQDMTEMEIESPDWIVKFHPIIDKIDAKIGHLLPANRGGRFSNLKVKDKVIAEYELSARAKQCFSVLQTLFQYQISTNKCDPFIQSEINESVTILMSVLEKNAENCSGIVLDKPYALLNGLYASYAVDAVSNAPAVAQFPVLEALVRWGAKNPKSSIGKLLDDSKYWGKQYHCLTSKEKKEYKIKEEDHMFFSYLHCGSKHVWHNAGQSLRELKTNNIVSTLLESDVIKSVIQTFKTVQQLAAACEGGFVSLNVMNNDREQQEIPSRESIGESLQQGMVRNINDSFLGKVASGICYAFNAVKNNFVTTSTKQEQSKKVFADLVKLVEKNALKIGAEDEGVRLVMDELIVIASQHKTDITIANALTVLAAKHFTSANKEKAFSLLTGLEREINNKKNTYCYNPIALNNGLGNKKNNDDGEDQNKKYWLDMASSDYILQKDGKEQQGCNTNTSSENMNAPYLHQDWVFIKFENKKENEEKDEEDSTKNIIFSLGCSKGAAATIRKIVTVALPLLMIANAIPGGYSAPVPNSSGDQFAPAMINITNAAELGMIGRSPQYPANGSYQFMNSFGARSFNQSIPYFTGSINGNFHTIDNLKTCLISTLGGNGIVQNLVISNANMSNGKCCSAVAGTAKDNAVVRLIEISHGYFHDDGIVLKVGARSLGAAVSILYNASCLDQIIIIDSTVISGTARYLGGVAGAMKGSPKMSDIVVINTNIENRGSSGKVGVMGGVVGLFVGDGILENVSIINSNITEFNSSASRFHLGGIVGYGNGYGDRASDSSNGSHSFKNLISINANLRILHSISERGPSSVGWVMGRMYSWNRWVMTSNILIIDSSIKMLHSGGHFGGVVGYLDGEVGTTGNIIVNSTIEVFSLGVASVKGNSCAGESIANANCMLDENIVFSGPTNITTADGSGSIYRYVMSDATDKCRWSKLPFITDNCAKDEKVFMVYKPSISGGLYGDEVAIDERITERTTERTSEPATKPTTVIIIGASASASAAVCAFCGGCYYCKKHHNGAFCFSGHRALSTDEAVATDNEQDGDESNQMLDILN